jgi:hypothetical protein
MKSINETKYFMLKCISLYAIIADFILLSSTPFISVPIVKAILFTEILFIPAFYLLVFHKDQFFPYSGPYYTISATMLESYIMKKHVNMLAEDVDPYLPFMPFI